MRFKPLHLTATEDLESQPWLCRTPGAAAELLGSILLEDDAVVRRSSRVSSCSRL